MRFRLSRAATRDVQDLTERIAADNPVVAVRISEELDRAFARIAEMPGIGHVRTDLSQHLRVWPFYGFLIVYEPRSTPLIIQRVIHGGRDITSEFRRRT